MKKSEAPETSGKETNSIKPWKQARCSPGFQTYFEKYKNYILKQLPGLRTNPSISHKGTFFGDSINEFASNIQWAWSCILSGNSG